MAQQENLLSHNFAATADGAQLSYYTIGTGPALLILHGAVTHALTHKELAIALSQYFTVHTASRRSRGLSSPYPASMPQPLLSATGSDASATRTYDPAFTEAVLSTEASDLVTLLRATKARYLIAVSSGALVALRYLLTAPVDADNSLLEKVILFEPPLFPEEGYPTTPSVTQYETERATNDEASAMVTAMQIVQLGPGWLPRWLMQWVVGHMFRSEEKREARADKECDKVGPNRGNVTMKGLGALLTYDFAIAEGMIGCHERFRGRANKGAGDLQEQGAAQDVERMVLLLGGDRSPGYLKKGLELLENATGARRVILRGAGHEVLCGSEMRGRPDKAVPIIREFFSV